jgi:hypothetical protein
MVQKLDVAKGDVSDLPSVTGSMLHYLARWGWCLGPSPLPPGDDEDHDDRLQRAGFQCVDELDTGALLGLDLYDRPEVGDFLALVWFPARAHPVYLPALPDLLGFLPLVLPLIQQATALGRMTDLYRQEAERRRRENERQRRAAG